jgi:predicted DNA-binding transcriptional regulator YafY
VADPLERLTNLLALLLETREPLTQDRIANELAGQYPVDAVARRGAFERDKALLRAEGVPIESVVTSDGGTAYRIDRNRFELADLGLTPAETRALQVAVATVHLGTGWGEDALLKLDAGSGAGTEQAAPATVDASMAVGAMAAPASVEVLPTLFDANSRRAPVTFGYRTGTRTVDPYGLVSRDGFWYLVGRDHDRDDVRTFRVDRMVGDVETGAAHSFTVPPGFEPAAALVKDARALGDGPSEALVLVDAGHAGRVLVDLGEPAVRERRGDGAIVFAVPCANLWAFRSWLLGFLEHAEVLEPASVRDHVVAWLAGVVHAGSQP